jgi:hypothetical protein
MSDDDRINERDLFGNDDDDGLSIGSVLAWLVVLAVGVVIWAVWL